MRDFTWAASIIPRSEAVDWVCPECGGIYRYPVGAFDVIVEGGAKYPDILGCGAYPFLIVSERVSNTWLEDDIRSFHAYPVRVAEVRSKRLAEDPPPYFRIDIEGRCRVDLAASGLQVLKRCARCNRLITKPSAPTGFRVVPSSWDGSPLFRDAEQYPAINFCTYRVLDLAREHQLTNFRFEPMRGPIDPAGKGIDYLKGTR